MLALIQVNEKETGYIVFKSLILRVIFCKKKKLFYAKKLFFFQDENGGEAVQSAAAAAAAKLEKRVTMVAW